MGRILVIDDDLVIAELIRVALSEAGHEAVGAAAGAERLDAIVTDLVAGEAYDAAAARRSVADVRSRFPGVPILVCTAHAAASRERDRLGADAVVTKPFDVDELVRTVEGLVRGRAR